MSQNPFQAIQTFSAAEASEAALYAGDGINMRTYRRMQENNPVYRRKLAGVLHFVQEVMAGERPMYELREMLSGQRHMVAFQETLSTSDFLNLFGDVIDRQLLAQYNSTEASWRSYCRRATVPDFRTVKRFTLDGLRANMAVVPQDDNYPAAKVSDGVYSYAVQKYGKTIPMAWETVINDDLNAFARIPELLAQSAIHTEEYFATGLFVSSTGPNATFFSNTNKNIINTTNGAANTNPVLGLAGLQDGFTILAAQQDAEGMPIAIDGVTLVVPPHLAVTAQNLVTNIQTMRIGAGGSTDGTAQLAYSVPKWLMNLRVVVNYFLPIIDTTHGKTGWYLFADPNISRPAIEIGFLRGHENPEIFRKMPNAMRLGGGVDPLDGYYDNDSVGYKIRHVIGGN